MRRMLLVAALPLLASGCASALPEVVDSADNPDSAYAAPVRYQSPIGSYTHRIPVDPKPWRGLNDAQTPKRG
ncbi:hypothetical protein PMI07_001122 [Rhizobium sp. CF080]|uniref:hypothetical protein n=1 Tax=Rhizobium sp. (strain CF080) TaxID=1144310 RepID=UPI0002718038|nr:hypothetical protein [Rhizobium sp. CF080]EUB96788.1 hypothetical protein PMI07_001122 [Rhizobium sp. CF080]